MVILEFLITGGAAMVWAAWEYWKIRPSKTDEPSGVAPDTRTSPEDPRHPDR